jgi:hypothetical protein
MTFPNLMAEYFEGDDVFPPTEKYLFIGGPKHGEYMEVVAGDRSHKIIVPASAPLLIGDSPVNTSGAAEIHTYMRRDITAEFGDERYVRDVYVHEGCPSPQVAQQLLMAVLMTDFIRGGRKVVTINGEST